MLSSREYKEFYFTFLDIFIEKEYYVDPSLKISNIELGTKQYPFKAIDDPFREIFNYLAQYNENFTIFLKWGSNLTIHTNSMPLFAIHSTIYLK